MDPELKLAFETVADAALRRRRRRERLLEQFRRFGTELAERARPHGASLAKQWLDGLRLELGDFECVLQLADFDDGCRWLVSLWLRHRSIPQWRRADEGQLHLSDDAHGPLEWCGSAVTVEELVSRLLELFAGALERYRCETAAGRGTLPLYPSKDVR